MGSYWLPSRDTVPVKLTENQWYCVILRKCNVHINLALMYINRLSAYASINFKMDFTILELHRHFKSWGDIFSVQTRCVSLTTVFRYKEVGDWLCTKCWEKNIWCSCHNNVRAKLFFTIWQKIRYWFSDIKSNESWQYVYVKVILILLFTYIKSPWS
jgi:hypothetical protein